MVRSTDYNALMRAVLLIALTAYLGKLIVTGDLARYIHPKFTWFTASAGIGFILMAAGQLVRALQGVAGHLPPFRTRLYMAFTLFLCVGFLTRPHTFGADLAYKQGLNVTNRTSKAAAAAAVPQVAAPAVTEPAPQPAPQPPAQGAPTPPPANTGAPTPPPASAGQPAAAPEPSPPGAARETIAITPKNFVDWMMEIYDYPQRHIGKRVVMEGFTFYPPEADANEFAVVRLVVTCHVAHAFPDGLLATFPGQPRPAQDTWHRVEGVLESHTYRGNTTVRLKIEKMTPTAMPPDPYVYP